MKSESMKKNLLQPLVLSDAGNSLFIYCFFVLKLNIG